MANEQVERPYKSHLPEETIARAKKMKEEDGLSCQKIADSLGVTYSTLRYALSPGERERVHICNKKWRKANPEYAKEHSKKWREDHPECVKERNKEWRKEHPEYAKERSKEWHKENPEYAKEHSKKYREKHPGYAKEHSKKWYEENPEYSKKYYENHRAECYAHNAKRRASIADATVGDLKEIAKIYKKAREEPNIQCYICGDLIPIGDREVDHIFPHSKGYPTAPFNLIPTHVKCNREKQDKMPDDIEIYDRSIVEKARHAILKWQSTQAEKPDQP